MMSDTCISFNSYSRMRRLSDLLDEVIFHAHDMNDPHRIRLANYLQQMDLPISQTNMHIEVFKFLSQINKPEHWANMASELRKPPLPKEIVVELEGLALRVDKHLSEISANIRNKLFGFW